MKKNILKKTAFGLMLFMLVFFVTAFVKTQKSYAQYPVFDSANYIQNVLNFNENAITANATLHQELQTSVLDKVATAFAKELLMLVTQQVVNWINNGFNGNPAFIQNPAAFFENIGDQLTGQFISSNGALSSLCSPFSLQVRLAIAQQQQQNDGYGQVGQNGLNGQNQYSCTLSTVIQNAQNANVSVSGFLSGDFSQGGIPAFAALTMQEQNSPNGAYLMAQDQLQQQIANATAQKQAQLSQGSGFLSWESCTPVTPAASASTNSQPSNDNSLSSDAGSLGIDGSTQDSSSFSTLNPSSNVSPSDPYNITAEASGENCQVETPGSVISGALNKHLAVPTENLELANSINDVVNAAFSELVVMALQKGLTSVSASSNGGSSYLQSAINSANAQSFSSSQSTLLNTVSSYLANAQSLYNNYNIALQMAATASSTIGSALSCYQNILAATTTNEYPSAISYIQNQISTLESVAASGIGPLLNTTEMKVNSASSTIGQYQQLYGQISSAQSLSDLSAPNQTLSSMSGNNSFITTVQVQSSANDLSTDESTIQPIQQQANTALQTCQSFNPATYGSNGSY